MLLNQITKEAEWLSRKESALSVVRGFTAVKTQSIAQRHASRRHGESEMNLAKISNDIKMNSYDFLDVVNRARQLHGESKVSNTHFLARVMDECDFGDDKIFTIPNEQNKKEMKCVFLDYDQMMLVGMRESKAVRKSVLAKIKELAAPSEDPVVLLARKVLEQNETIDRQVKQLEVKDSEIDRLQGVCNTVTAQFAPGLTISTLCKSFNGVNIMQVNNTLIKMGMLNKTKHGYEPSSYARDNYFTVAYEKFEKPNGDEGQRSNVTLTLKGAKWMYKAYISGKLPMKKNWDGSLVHVEFEVKQ